MDAGTKQDKNSPREKANPFSVVFFIWTLKIFKIGCSKDLEEGDLFKPLKKDASLPLGNKLEKIWNLEYERGQAKGKKPNLIKCIFKAFWYDFFKLALLSIINDLGFRMIEPQIVGCLLQYFKKNSTMPRDHAIGYAATLVITTFCKGLLTNHFMFLAYHTGQRIRVACCALIYRKTLKISRTAFGSSAAGKVVNLLSNDVSRFDLICTFINSMWTGPLATVVIAILVYNQVGYAGFFGILIIFLVVPIQAFNGKLTSIFRLQTALKTDERIRLMSELLNGIRVVKMYAWERSFSKLVTLARKYEIQIIRKTSYIRGIFMMFMLCTTRLAMFATLIAIVLLGGEIHVDKVFVIISYLNIVSQIMSMMFVRGIAEIAESMVAIRRIRDYLLCDEFKNSNKFLTFPPPKPQDILQNPDLKLEKNDEYMISLEKFTARWPGSSESNGNNLDEITFKVPKGELIAIIGPVGSGKSSILQAILGELNPNSGSICINSPSISYASQDPWVFSASVRQNITFGQNYDSNRYSSVCRSCSLYPDFQQFPGGDLTIVGERGASLSGGQKARINLARAVYHSGDIMLLDDPLSAVDPHVANSLFHDCIVNYLKGKTRILVTHQIQFIKECDRILILDNGRVHTYGSFDEIISQSTFDSLICLNEDDKDSDDQEVLTDKEHDIKIESKPKTTPKLLRQISRMSIKSQISLQNQENNEKIAAIQREQRRELTSKGRFSGNTYVQYGKSSGNVFVLGSVIVLFLLAQVMASVVDYFVSYWSAREEYRVEMNFNKRRVERSVSEFDPLLSQETYMYIYSGLIVILFIITFTRSMVYYTSCMRASRKLHDLMFEAVIRAPVRFFDINPSGRLLNRFTKDIGAIDELLPKAIMDATQIILMMTGALILSVVINPYFLIPIIVLFILFYYDRKMYLKTSKNIKRIEGVVKSPIFTHLNATLQGLTTIRAYGAQKTLSLEFDNHQNLHTSAWYMFISTSSAFGFSLDCFCVIYLLVIIITFFVLMETGLVSNNDVGLAISQSLMLTGYLQWGMRQSADVANQMMSVERVLEYMETKPEPNLENAKTKASSDWPNSGLVEMKNVSLRYVENEVPVLKNLNFLIQPKEKIGIVGRTGAGKSSLIGALFRLAPIEGEILIDGIDTSFISLQELRSRISIIPQEPVLFSGTMRKNIDPVGEYPDYILWKILEDVELKDSLSSAGLDTHVDEGGTNFSVGQRQLVCLARAILRNNKVLVLDEATANVDSHTDTLIQQTIRSKFSNCTVLTIAHRLHTIMDSDRILVMDAGRVKEFASPHELLSNPESAFTSMVEQTGKQQRDLLIRIAKETWLNKTQNYSAANELSGNETKKEI